MKKQLLLFMLFVLLVGCALLTSCMLGTPAETTAPTTTTAPATTAPVTTAPVTTAAPITVTPVFTDLTVDYDGTAKAMAVTGLPEGSIVYYSVNGGAYTTEVALTDAGEYAVYATVYLPAGYVSTTTTLSATLTINKLALPAEYADFFADAEVAYTGEYLQPKPAVALPAGVTYSVVGAPIKNAGDTATYAILFDFGDPAMNKNYENRLDGVELTVTKADVDMSGVSLDDKTLPFLQGTPQTIELTGTLPAFLKVSYEGGGMERGEYEITATFSFKDPADANNYNLPAPMTATLTIGAGQFDLSTYNFADRELPYTGVDQTPRFAATQGLAFIVTMKKDGAPVTEAVEPGDYEVTVSFEVTDPTLYVKPDDKTFTLTILDKPLIELEIVDLSGITFVWTYTEPFIYDGTQKTVTLSDETLAALAEIGVTVEEYGNNVKTGVGDYVAFVQLACDYEHKFAPGDSVRSIVFTIMLPEDDNWSDIVSP